MDIIAVEQRADIQVKNIWYYFYSRLFQRLTVRMHPEKLYGFLHDLREKLLGAVTDSIIFDSFMESYVPMLAQFLDGLTVTEKWHYVYGYFDET